MGNPVKYRDDLIQRTVERFTAAGIPADRAARIVGQSSRGETIEGRYVWRFDAWSNWSDVALSGRYTDEESGDVVTIPS